MLETQPVFYGEKKYLFSFSEMKIELDMKFYIDISFLLALKSYNYTLTN